MHTFLSPDSANIACRNPPPPSIQQSEAGIIDDSTKKEQDAAYAKAVIMEIEYEQHEAKRSV